MYKIKIISRFSAAHSLRNYKGKCEALHGHNWQVEVLVSSLKLNSSGMVMDFSEVKKIASNVLEELDHHHLNELDYFSASAPAKGWSASGRGGGSGSGGKGHNPSSEEIARYIFIKLKEEISARGCKLEEVKVWETENSCAAYQE